MKALTTARLLCFSVLLVIGQSFQLPHPSHAKSISPLVKEPTATKEKEHLPSKRYDRHHHSLVARLAKLSANGVDEENISMAISLVGSTTSVLVSFTFFCVLAWKRDALMVTFFIGSILNGILSKVLKKLIGESRPPELQTFDMTVKPSDGGMPSSHAMSLGFIGIFTALNLPWTRLPLAIYVLVSLYYRIAVNLHTVEQIAVGLVLGSAHGTLWYSLCQGTTTILGVNPKEFVASHLLNEHGLFPWPALAVPIILGAAVVGSFERRISVWLGEKRD